MRHTTSVKDPYKVLGVKGDADGETIKAAFREKAKVLHPDTTTDETKKKDMEEQFKELSEAYSVLSDPEARARARARFNNPSSHFNGPDLNDIMNRVFGYQRGGFNFNRSSGGGNPNVFFQQVQSFDIDVFTLILGGEVEVRFSDGRERKISIPPNTPLNARFQLKLGNNVVIILTPNVVVSTLSEEKLKKLREIFTERFP